MSGSSPSPSSSPARENPDPAPDAVLLERYFTSADTQAMAALFERHSAAAYRLALEYLGNAADAEEAVQTAFLHILQKGNGAWAREKTNVRGWMMSIVVNTCLMKLREEKRRKNRQDAVAAEAPKFADSPSDTAETVDAAVRAVRGLPERYRLPLLLHFLEGFSIRDVARTLSIPEKTIHSQIDRGLEQVRQSLAAAGFATSLAALPVLLKSATLPHAPAALTPALHALVVRSAGKAVAKSAAPAAKGVLTATSAKLALAGGLLAAAVVAAAVHFSGGKSDLRADAGGAPPPVVTPVAPATTAIDPRLARILETKIDARFRRDYLNEVLFDLGVRTNLRSAIPKPLEKTFLFSEEESGVTVQHVLEKCAADGKLALEYHGDTVVFWKAADDAMLDELLKKLKSTDVEARCEAVYDLTLLSDKRIYSPLIHMLNDPDAAVSGYALHGLASHAAALRMAGARDLAELSAVVAPKLQSNPTPTPTPGTAPWDTQSLQSVVKSPTAAETQAAEEKNTASVDAALKLLKDADPAKRAGAATTLRVVVDPRATDALLANLTDTDLSVRTSVVSALGDKRDPRAIEPLLTLLKDPNAGIRSLAVIALAKYRDPRAVDPLLALLRDADPQVVSNAARALGVLREPRATEPLFTFLKTATPDLATGVLFALRDPQADAALLALLKDANAMNLAGNGPYDQLGHSREPRAVDMLLELTKVETEEIKSNAALALGYTGDPRALEPLAALARTEPWTRQAVAIGALGWMQSPRVIAPLHELLKHPQYLLRANAEIVLLRLKDPRALEPFAGLLGDESNMVRAYAAGALGLKGNERAIQVMLDLAKDPDALAREYAATFMELQEPRWLDALIVLLKDENSRVRSAAARRLERSTEPRVVAAMELYRKDEQARKAASGQPAAPPVLPSSGDF